MSEQTAQWDTRKKSSYPYRYLLRDPEEPRSWFDNVDLLMTAYMASQTGWLVHFWSLAAFVLAVGGVYGALFTLIMWSGYWATLVGTLSLGSAVLIGRWMDPHGEQARRS